MTEIRYISLLATAVLLSPNATVGLLNNDITCIKARDERQINNGWQAGEGRYLRLRYVCACALSMTLSQSRSDNEKAEESNRLLCYF